MELCEGWEKGGYQRMDYVYAKIDEHGIHWHGCVKHCDYTVTTANLAWSTLNPVEAARPDDDEANRCSHGMFYTGAGACPACER